MRSNDIIRTNGGNDTINPRLGEIDYVYGGEGIDHLILDYSIGDTGTGINFNTVRFRDGLLDRTFLALNDSIIEITGFTGNLNNLSIL
ncbi:hypothetical protein HW132_13495 [Brasilonema sp. CT11]|nr:hypothetical protein [Brasilonema sp. CT11]